VRASKESQRSPPERRFIKFFELSKAHAICNRSCGATYY
jgi:hypothetical protein